MITPNESNLWSAYFAHRSIENRNRVVMLYLDVVDIIVSKAKKSCPHADYDDLQSFGHEALIKCVERYQADQKTSFRTYLTNRLFGAMLDSCREVDPISRTARTRIKQWDEASETLHVTFGRPPSEEEIEQRLGIDHDAWKVYIRQARIVSNKLSQVEDVSRRRYDFTTVTASTREANPYKLAADEDEFESMLKSVVLAKDHETILRMRFKDGMTPTEIGLRLGCKPQHVEYIMWKHGGRIARKHRPEFAEQAEPDESLIAA